MSKNSFILFDDLREPVSNLTVEDAGLLFKAIFEYRAGNEITGLSPPAQMAFTFIRQQIDRSVAQYEERCRKNLENINKRWKKEDTTVYDGKKDDTKNTIVYDPIPPDPDPDPDPEKKKDTLSRQVIDHLNGLIGKNFKHNTKNTLKHIGAREKEGYTLDDFKWVIDSQVSKWKDQKEMVGYLRPDTLFGPKFEGYLQAALPLRKKRVKDMTVEEKQAAGYLLSREEEHELRSGS